MNNLCLKMNNSLLSRKNDSKSNSESERTSRALSASKSDSKGQRESKRQSKSKSKSKSKNEGEKEREGIRRGRSLDAIRWLRMRLYGACVSLGMRANPSTCRVVTSVGT